ncbi:MAG: hypothetical protein AABZ57_07650, partial [Candidatus Margulisiibacteriota bacterium]
ELEIDLDDFALPHIEPENEQVDFRGTLKRTGTELPDEELLNYLEGNLSTEQQILFEEKLLRDKDLVKDHRHYQYVQQVYK